MDKTLYDIMNWADVEEIVYSESSRPQEILGAHKAANGVLVQTYMPGATKVEVLTQDGKTYTMELEDESGFYACLLPNMQKYKYRYTFDNGTVEETADQYMFDTQFTESDLKRFAAGNHYEIYKKLGSHPMTIDGVKGTYFAVWAPCAIRVSVVGDFNLWDGRRNQMRRLGESGVYDLFIPELGDGAVYKYEVKTTLGEPMLKTDPYGTSCEMRPNNASIVCDISGYKWTDDAWMKSRSKHQASDKNKEGTPLNIYEVHLGSWMNKPLKTDGEGNEIYGSEFYNYREIAVKLADYVKSMGYTHIELMPVMEHPLDESWGYQVTGYYAPTSRYGTPQDFMYFMDYMHGEGIGVILDWVPAHFPKDLQGLNCFDGSHVYEHADPRKSEHPHWGTMIFNYGRPEVKDFLIANSLYWAGMYHADGIRMDAVASMLYLDYGKNPGEWVPNIYGGHENLEAIDFLHQLDSEFKKEYPDVLLIAEESTAWPKITDSVDDEGMGFDYKWNMGWMNDFLGYMSCDPIYRGDHYGELTFSMLYQYSENFILVLSHDEVVHGKASLVNKMPGSTFEEKFANLRAAYGFMMLHPGKKLLFMGQEYAQMDEWNEKKGLEWELLQYDIHKQMQGYVKKLNHFYMEHPALWKLDTDPEGFEWINCHSYEECVVAFIRRSKDTKEDLLCICNFSNLEFPKFDIGVPYYGKFKELFNSDGKPYGGSGVKNASVKTAKAGDVDDRDYFITVAMPKMSVMVYSCEKLKEPAKKAEKASAKKTVKAEKKTPAKKAVKVEKDTTKKAEKKVSAKKTVKAEKTTTKKAEKKVSAKKTVKAEKDSAKKAEKKAPAKKASKTEKTTTKKAEKKSPVNKTLSKKTEKATTKKTTKKKTSK